MLMLFREDCEYEKQKRSSERKKFESKMTREENIIKESHKRLNSKIKGETNIKQEVNPFLNANPWPTRHIKSNMPLVAPPPASKKISEMKPLGGKGIQPTPEDLAKELSAFGNVLATVSHL